MHAVTVPRSGSSMRSVLHFVSLAAPGGVERHLVEFVERAHALRPDLRQLVLGAGAPVHRDIAAALGAALIGHEKRLGRLKLPSVPGAVRRGALRRTVARAAPDVVVIWNRAVRSASLLEAVEPAAWIAWEHGSAWLTEPEAPKRAFYARCPRIVANSEATRRVLALRWGREEQVDVCRNALHPSLVPRAPRPKTPPAARLKLGMACRLVPVKGAPLALHALALLGGRGVEAELHVAGDGASRPALEALARRLGVASAVIWHGHVRDMAAFYARIDCLVHASLHESFGLVCLEAAAHGCPVVTTAVDALPEVVAHGASGLLIPPELPVSDYPRLGGSLEDLPEFVYDPIAGRITAPKLASPEALADALERLADAATFSRLSAGAVDAARERLDFDAHVEAVLGVVQGLHGRAARDAS